MSVILEMGEFASFIGLLGSFYCLAEAFTVYRLMRLKGVRTTALVATASGTKLLTMPARSSTNYKSPAITILKPLHKVATELRTDLETLFAQDYTGPIQIVFGLHSESDPAKEIVDQLRGQHPSADINVVVSSKTHGANAKVTNLLNMYPFARNPILVVCDGDIAVPPNWLSTLIRTLDAPGIGLASCLYYGVPERPLFWPIMSAMGMSYSFLPNVVLAAAAGLEMPCLGATMAIRQNTLTEVGGFERFAEVLADDYELGRAVRAEGYSVALSTSVVRHNAGEKQISDFFAHELRWARTIRMINPMGYALSAITYNTGFATLGVLSGPTAFALSILAFAVGARIVLQHVVDRAFGCWSGPAWLLPLRDLVSFLLFTLSFMSRKVRWDRRVFYASPSGPRSNFKPASGSFRPTAPQDPRPAGVASAPYS
ncbi:MAG TPA: bacteriohopanetetrol glucosamine biosynthesis glycosyltransferase HpnI [Rhizomicrobium sp.]|nr:bacteriohopanetetrol glucosamine biosynthesis glycosyltransferase HpnI [Rhizomicrobium sp.]